MRQVRVDEFVGSNLAGSVEASIEEEIRLSAEVFMPDAWHCQVISLISHAQPLVVGEKS
jgi:hypothetical protein